MTLARRSEQASATLEVARACGLTDLEWGHLVETLGRSPSFTEVQMIGVMWSEHCSYKNTKPFLKKLLVEAPHVITGPGENAGLVRLDDKRAICFKIESHNHPSFVEPFQGAATGVGGILRDIFTMGARPIAVGDYLRFGPLGLEKHRFLLNGVVSGISHYGNCIGIPNLGGQVVTDPCYEGNILVNVFALGIVDQDKVFLSSGAPAGHSVMLWGAKTGRDGIHGASLLASADFDQDAESKEQKIRVQVGDPFKEKCLMEATLECMQNHSEDLLAIQDMGAAGITCSTMEIASKSEGGMLVDLDKVPQRETEMMAYEILLSESQERMLAVVKKGTEDNFTKILKKWGCDSALVGETTAEKNLVMTFRGQKVVDLPVHDLIDPPTPKIEMGIEPRAEISHLSSDIPQDVSKEWETLKGLLSDPSVGSKQKVYERYDSTVGASTVVGPGSEAAVLSVGRDENPNLGIAFKGAGLGRLYRIHSRIGAEHSLTRTIRSIATTGAKALAYTDGINMGNPANPKVTQALAGTVEGLNAVARLFDCPCIGGNVSLYNQTHFEKGPRDIDPTTIVVSVGTLADVRKVKPSYFQKEENEIWLISVKGDTDEIPFGSLYEKLFWKENFNRSPFINLKGEKSLQSFLIEAVEAEIFESLRTVTDGGLATALAEACFTGPEMKGFEGELRLQDRKDKYLFGESAGRVLVEISPHKRADLMNRGRMHELETTRIGRVSSNLQFKMRPLFHGPVAELKEAWFNALP